jgi:hypothetical protein
MLNQHEVKAHNVKVALKAADKLIDRVDPVEVTLEHERRMKRLKKATPLPKIDPAKREWKRPPHVAKFRSRVQVAMPTAFPMRNEVREYLRGERE